MILDRKGEKDALEYCQKQNLESLLLNKTWSFYLWK